LNALDSWHWHWLCRRAHHVVLYLQLQHPPPLSAAALAMVPA
jgi:hypothetical protein